MKNPRANHSRQTDSSGSIINHESEIGLMCPQDISTGFDEVAYLRIMI